MFFDDPDFFGDTFGDTFSATGSSITLTTGGVLLSTVLVGTAVSMFLTTGSAACTGSIGSSLTGCVFFAARREERRIVDIIDEVLIKL